MRLFFVSILLAFGSPVLASNACKAVHSSESSSGSSLRGIEERLKSYFGKSWQTPVELSDADLAKRLFEKMKRFGTSKDFEVLDAYVQILQAVSRTYYVRAPGFYIDINMGERPKSSHFQERHWDWAILDGYFFNSPSNLTFTKERDLSYLKAVLESAKSSASRKPLRQVLQETNQTLAIQALSDQPLLQQSYQQFVDGKKYSTLYERVRSKIFEFGTKNSDLHEVLKAFRNSNSSFDLFILNRFFEMTLKFKTGDWKPPIWLQLTDWRVFEMGLPTGSLSYLTDFLFQNSHDWKAKIYLLQILEQMRDMEPSPADNFYFSFLQARARIDQRIQPTPAPAVYQTDLHIFSASHEPGEHEPTWFHEVVVTWNQTLGRLQANVIRSHHVDQAPKAMVSSNPMLRNYVKKYFDQLRKNGTYTAAEIDHFESKELNSPLLETVYLSFTKPGSDQMLAMIRIFNATRLPSFIERDFPRLRLPERATGEPVYELGRLMAGSEVEGGAFPHIMARVADYFANTSDRGTTYGDGDAIATRYYGSFGYQKFATPQDLNRPAGSTPMWVVRLPVRDLIRRFAKPFESLRLRNRSMDAEN